MVIIDSFGYLSRRRKSSCPRSGRAPQHKPYTNIYIAKADSGNGVSGYINISNIRIPEKYLGKRIRIKAEIEEVE